MSQNLLARIVDKQLTNQDRHCLTALSFLYFGALTSACRLLSVVRFFCSSKYVKLEDSVSV